MPWNGCDFEGDPQTIAELLSKSQFNFDRNDETGSWWDSAYASFTIPNKPMVLVEVPDSLADVGCYKHSYLREYPCSVALSNWDGGVSEYYLKTDNEDDPQETYGYYLATGSLVFQILGKVSGLGKFAVTELAKNDYKKDLQGAKNKMGQASGEYERILPDVEQAGQNVIGVSAQLDGFKRDLESIQLSMSYIMTEINKVLVPINILKGALSVKDSLLAKGKADLAYAKNRNNFPPGIPGAKAQQQAIQKANADIASASKDIVKLEGELAPHENSLQDLAKEYNDQRLVGLATADAILAGQRDIDAKKVIWENQVARLKAPVALRNDAIQDVSKAQDTMKPKIAFANNLGQLSIGANGVSEGLKYASTGEYIRATGSALNTGIDVANDRGYLGLGLNPYIPLIKTAISSGMKQFQAGGNVEGFVWDLGEELVKAKTAQAFFQTTGSAIETMAVDPYTSWQILAQQSHTGIDVLGRISMTGSIFFPSPLTPLLPIAIPVVKAVVPGALSTAVEVGHKWAIGNVISAPIGSRRLSLLSVGMFGAIGSVVGGPITALESFFGDDSERNMAVEIQKMAMTGMENFEGNFNYRFGVGLRPVIPVPNDKYNTSDPINSQYILEQ